MAEEDAKKYAVLVRYVDENTGDIKVVKNCEGTQLELLDCVNFWKIRAMFNPHEKAYLVFAEYADLCAIILGQRKPQECELKKFAERII